MDPRIDPDSAKLGLESSIRPTGENWLYWPYFCCSQNFVPLRIWVQQKFESNNNFCTRKIWIQNKFGSKNMFGAILVTQY